MHAIIGIDIGTQGTKAEMYDENFTILATAYVPLNLITDNQNHIIQDPEEIFNSVITAINHLVNTTGISDVKAIGIDGQMAGILAIDDDWNAVYPYDSWLDTQCKPFVEQMKIRAEDEIITSTGGQVTYAHAPKILWMKNVMPEIYKRVAKFVTLSSYIVGRLCNLKAENAFIDDTHLHFTGFADNENRKWNVRLLNTFDIEEDKMPDIVSSDKIIGAIDTQIAQMCNLKKGTLIIAGMGDTIASIIGAGIIEKGMIFDVSGTASVFSLSTDNFTADTKYRTMMCARTAINDLFVGYAYISGGGLCLRWIKDIVKGTYTELDEKAMNVPIGSNGLYFIPHFAGRTCPNDASVRGTFLGLTWNHKEDDMYRAVMESIAYEYSYYSDILKEYGSSASIIYGVGGGSKSKIFNQIKADVLNLPYISLNCSNTATYASAIIAAKAVGVINNIKEVILKGCEKQEVIYPTNKYSIYYREHALTYRKIVNNIANIYHVV